MKFNKIVLLLAFVFGAVLAQAQVDAISKYFNKYMDDEAFTTVYISGKMLSMFADLSDDDVDQEVRAIADQLEGLRILTTEDNGAKYYKEALSVLNTKEYEVLMNVRDEGEEVKFLIKDDDKSVKELLLLVGGEDEFVLMSFVGSIDLKKLSQLSDMIDIDGMEHLHDINHDHDHDDDHDHDHDDD